MNSTSPVVQILLNLGAVPYVKTNVPQTMMVSALTILNVSQLLKVLRPLIRTILCSAGPSTPIDRILPLVGRLGEKGH